MWIQTQGLCMDCRFSPVITTTAGTSQVWRPRLPEIILLLMSILTSPCMVEGFLYHLSRSPRQSKRGILLQDLYLCQSRSRAFYVSIQAIAPTRRRINVSQAKVGLRPAETPFAVCYGALGKGLSRGLYCRPLSLREENPPA